MTISAKIALARAGSKALVGPLSMKATFVMSHKDTRKHGQSHTARPDADNLAKGVMDCLENAGIFADDSRIARLELHKIYGPKPGAIIDLIEQKQAPASAVLELPSQN